MIHAYYPMDQSPFTTCEIVFPAAFAIISMVGRRSFLPSFHVRDVAQNSRPLSSRMVTGPSFTSSTSIIAPKTL